ncbi:MAG: glycosyltransferase family 4 protein [Candidatus Woesearchaeota archaeon]
MKLLDEWLNDLLQQDYLDDKKTLFWLLNKSKEMNSDTFTINEQINYIGSFDSGIKYIFPEGFKVLQLGIPTSINSGVVKVMLNLNKVFAANGIIVASINHWWHRYYFRKFVGTPFEKKVKVELSPFNLLNDKGKCILTQYAFKNIASRLHSDFKFYPNIIHIHTHTFVYDNALDFSLKKYFQGVPVVYTLHAFIPYIRLNHENRIKLLTNQMTQKELKAVRENYGSKRERAQFDLIKRSDAIITISQVHKEAFDIIYPEYADKCFCVPNGTDFDEYNDLKEVYAKKNELQHLIAPNGEKVMIYVGRIEAQKGSQKLIDGFNLAAEKYADLRLVLVGANEQKLPELLQMGLNKSFVERIHFAGWIKDKKVLAAYYKLADIMVQPVASKNLYGMAVLESMMLEVPVITCEGKYSFGVTKNANTILKAVDSLYTQPELVKAHVQRVKEEVIGEHSLTAMLKKHLEVFEKTTASLKNKQ